VQHWSKEKPNREIKATGFVHSQIVEWTLAIGFLRVIFSGKKYVWAAVPAVTAAYLAVL